MPDDELIPLETLTLVSIALAAGVEYETAEIIVDDVARTPGQRLAAMGREVHARALTTASQRANAGR